MGATVPHTAGVPKLLLSVNEVAYALGISRRQVYRLTEDNKLPVVRIGDRRLYRVTDVERLAAEGVTS